MIASVVLAVQVILASPKPKVIAASTKSPAIAALSSSVVLEHYAEALAHLREPQVVSFDYTLEQTGSRTMDQTHRVFRKGANERDETLVVDGKKLEPPTVRIFRGRRNRYSVLTLAPRPQNYMFTYVGPKKRGTQTDYVFALERKGLAPFAITTVTIDGAHFLPSALEFRTGSHAGRGSFTFGRRESWWVAMSATAHALTGSETADEHLTFSAYRFPKDLPPSTFTERRVLPKVRAPEPL